MIASQDPAVSSLNKMLAILDFFTADTQRITPDVVALHLDCSRTTAYRYLKVLTQAGLLSTFRGSYVLGPRVIELDYLIRRSDPLLAAAERILPPLAEAHDCDFQVFAMFGDRILATFHTRSAADVTVSFGRGRQTPLFRGAGAKVVIAGMTSQAQRSLFERHRDDAAAAGLGSEWREFRATMQSIRRSGAYTSHGELDPETVGIGAPLGLPTTGGNSALVMVMSRRRFALTDERRAIGVVSETAERITAAVDRV